jgi:hypothetical protein
MFQLKWKIFGARQQQGMLFIVALASLVGYIIIVIVVE